MNELLLLILLPPLAGAALNGLLGRRLSLAAVSTIACGAAGVSMLAALLAAWTYSHLPTDPAPHIHRFFTWLEAGDFRADFALYYDRLTLVMTVTVTVVAFLIHLYSRGYMEREGGYYRFFAYLNLFLFMMLTLVTAANYPLMFVGWEGVGLCSYLLIGFYFRKKSAADAGKKAFIVTRLGDVGFTLGMIWLFWAFGSVDFDDVFRMVGALPIGERESALAAIGVLLFLGAVGKSAQLPLYVWLPDAMEGPTPVSALIHAATMVTAGVYLVARSNILYAHAPLALEIIGVVGCLTAFFAATIALVQNDLKRLLAYSTISQLGTMFVGLGVGVFSAGIFHLMTHAFFKSLLFLGAGSVMHALAGELDMRRMGGLRHRMKTTWLTFLVATLALSGFPGLSGFFSKDQILVGAYEGPLGKTWLYALATLTAGLTAFYMFRALFLTFHGASRLTPERAHHAHESGRTMTAPLVVLSFFSVVAGYVSWPKALGGSEAFHHYLEPVFGSSERLLASAAPPTGGETSAGLALMLVSVLVAGLGIFLAYAFYLKSPAWPERLRAAFGGVYRVLVNKYYVDELYGGLFVRPLERASEKILWGGVDAAVIDDGMVHGAAGVTGGVGSILRRVQSGNLRAYTAWILFGAALWLTYLLLGS